jgi:hypothetical protein
MGRTGHSCFFYDVFIGKAGVKNNALGLGVILCGGKLLRAGWVEVVNLDSVEQFRPVKTKDQVAGDVGDWYATVVAFAFAH